MVPGTAAPAVAKRSVAPAGDARGWWTGAAAAVVLLVAAALSLRAARRSLRPRPLSSRSLRVLLDEYEAEHGPIPEEELAQAGAELEAALEAAEEGWREWQGSSAGDPRHWCGHRLAARASTRSRLPHGAHGGQRAHRGPRGGARRMCSRRRS